MIGRGQAAHQVNKDFIPAKAGIFFEGTQILTGFVGGKVILLVFLNGHKDTGGTKQ